ncbi:MAG TPA: FAD-binding oxidoreductase [Acidobacteriota bacterium]|nr:FAD-binding oxidoreductase [Acidobacteriota bacterium]
MTQTRSSVVVCGAGMAGVAAAYHLVVNHGIRDVLLLDERPPLTLTSDKGTGAYRNWWPGPGHQMVQFINRSIDLLEELAQLSNNVFELNRRGYVFLTGDPEQAQTLRETASAISALGAGPVRDHSDLSTYVPSPAEGFEHLPTGADFLTSPDAIQHLFPYLTSEAQAMLHVRRAGWMIPVRLGQWMLDQITAQGGRFRQGKVSRILTSGNRVQGVEVDGKDTVASDRVVIAAGPLLNRVAALAGLELPVTCELHGKIALNDTRGVLPDDAPLLIWNDPVMLPWTDAERDAIWARGETHLLERFPAGVHVRPRGKSPNHELLIIWTYDTHTQEATFPPIFPNEYPEVLIRGLSRLIPGLTAYFGQGATAYTDGGYYCKTSENRPLIGPLPVEGMYVIGALSGFGIMASQAAAELLAAHVTGTSLPDYAPVFRLERYADPAYQALLETGSAWSGQL